ncbi:MAG: radical SAM family heme chaperone HemW [Myxococcaceae bacterium]|nr:radical SAM family heme chaperone HemW [Myxococcaceae bacterium]
MDAARFGVYVHFPYCLSKCPYCDFASIVARQIPEARYAEAIARELELRIAAVPSLAGRAVESVYFGGGTPSLWDPTHVRRVLDLLRARLWIVPDAEVTLEANPGAADAERFAGYRAAGINRLSIGVQSFQPATLAFLGRSHDGAMAERAYAAARAAGFDNVSLDFIYGVPGQTLDQVREDAVRATGLGADHLSAYALTLDRESLAEEVPLARRLARGEVTLPPDEEVLQMQRTVRDVYRAAGLLRYEISNYARPGRHSRHNAAYWTGGEYLALGTGATGFILEPEGTGGVRYANHRSAERYLVQVEQDSLPVASVETLTARELFSERVAMGLRLSTGIDLQATCRAFGEDYAPRAKVVEALVTGGLAVQDGPRLLLTDRGADVHSAISARLM